MKKYLVTLLALFISLLAFCQSKPVLVVGIQVSGLREDYLNMFMEEFGNQGFKRLISEGTYFNNIFYPYHYAGKSADIATLSTGANPYSHGICTNAFYNPKSYKMQPFLQDNAVKAVNGTENYSAKSLICTTVADQLNEYTFGKSRIYSIAFDPENAIYAVGHSGLPLWIDKKTGNWTSSTYYTENLPEWVTKHGVDGFIGKEWEPLMPAGYYVSASSGAKGFKYKLKEACNGAKMYSNFSTSPFANAMITDMALKTIDLEKLGKDIYPDLLYLNYELQNFYLNENEMITIELEDSYLRLDKDLAALLDALDKRFKKENVVVYLISDRTTTPTKPYNNRITYNEFNSQRYAALLNSYLMAHYGRYKWVQACYDGHIYLDKKMAEEKQVPFKELQDKSIEFFSTIPGIASILPSYLLKTINHKFSYHPQNAGDLIYTLQVGYYEVDSKGKKTDFYNKLNQPVMLMLWGGKIQNQIVNDRMSVLMLSHTISDILRISTPNCSSEGSLIE
jgi:predicted AlkP superfamily pyrophosphatase or phosphodiesterase